MARRWSVKLLGVLLVAGVLIVGSRTSAQQNENNEDNTTTLHIITKVVDSAVADAPYVSISFEARGGKLPYTWTATGLPEGLSFGTSDVIHGKTSQVGMFPIVVTVTDSAATPISATANFNLTVTAGKK